MANSVSVARPAGVGAGNCRVCSVGAVLVRRVLDVIMVGRVPCVEMRDQLCRCLAKQFVLRRKEGGNRCGLYMHHVRHRYVY